MSTKSQKDPLDQGDLKNDQVSEYSISPPKFRKAVYLSAIVAAVGGFICGYDTGAITGSCHAIISRKLFYRRHYCLSSRIIICIVFNDGFFGCILFWLFLW
jgi:hypothetical protein